MSTVRRQFFSYAPEGSQWLDHTIPLFLIDFYKVGHVNQYPKDIKRVFVNFTPRSTRVEGETGMIFFGLQRFIKKVLIGQFNTFFFSRPWEEIEKEYVRVIRATLGVQNPKTDHIKRLHEGGYLPIDIYALPEGTYVPLGVPACVIVNSEDHAYWLPNYLETTFSANVWLPSTSASTAHRYRRLFIKHAIAAGETDFGPYSFVNYQGHDFAYRGLEGDEGAKLSGLGHLLSFQGTDTVPAILDAEKYYHAVIENGQTGGSVPATEHSVMCAGGKDNEQETYRRLIEDEYPTGIVSIVSDTWSLWDVLTKIAPALKDKILARQPNGPIPAKVVFRPDSGDPVKILTGDDSAPNMSPAWLGAISLLNEVFGTTREEGKLHLINKAGLIYGDSITVERADQILTRARNQRYSPYNFVFGIGSYTYQYVTRDTYNMAFKATAVEREGERERALGGNYRWIEAIYKDPVTDNAHKKSHRGIPVVYADSQGNLTVHETTDASLLDNSAFRKVFNGNLLVDDYFEVIRDRVRARDYVDVLKH